MANYDNLKESVSDAIKTNGNNEITGALLQNTLLTIINTLGKNATFAGIAKLSTNPGTPDGNVFYLAADFGTYNNFKTPSDSVPPNVPLSNDGTQITFFYNSGNGWKNVRVAAPMSLGEVIPTTVFADELIPNGSVAFAKTPGTYKIFENATLASNEVCVFTKSKDAWKQMKFSVGGGGTGGGIGEAPDDGKAYVRRSTEWINIEQTDEYKGLATKSDVDAVTRQINVSLLKTQNTSECYLSARLENKNENVTSECKLFLLRMKRKKRNLGIFDEELGKTKSRKYSGRMWAETGVGLHVGTYDKSKITGDLSEFWPLDTYEWSIASSSSNEIEIIPLFGGRNMNDIEALPAGLHNSLVTYERHSNNIPLGVGRLFDKYVRDMPGNADYSMTGFYFPTYRSLTCATFGVAVYKKRKGINNNKGHDWERISNIAAFKIKHDSNGNVRITIL